MSDQGNPGPGPAEPKEEKPAQISILVKDQDKNGVTFKVKTTTKLSKLMDAYAKSQQKATDTLRFFFDGNRVQGEDTPGSLGIEDGNQLDVFLEQTGGSF